MHELVDGAARLLAVRATLELLMDRPPLCIVILGHGRLVPRSDSISSWIISRYPKKSNTKELGNKLRKKQIVTTYLISPTRTVFLGNFTEKLISRKNPRHLLAMFLLQDNSKIGNYSLHVK